MILGVLDERRFFPFVPYVVVTFAGFECGFESGIAFLAGEDEDEDVDGVGERRGASKKSFSEKTRSATA